MSSGLIILSYAPPSALQVLSRHGMRSPALFVSEWDILRNKIQAAQRQTHCNDIRIYEVCASWLSVFNLRQVIWLSRHSQLPDIME